MEEVRYVHGRADSGNRLGGSRAEGQGDGRIGVVNLVTARMVGLPMGGVEELGPTQ